MILSYLFEFFFICCFNNIFLPFQISYPLDLKKLNRSALRNIASKHKYEVKLIFNFTSAFICFFRMRKFFVSDVLIYLVNYLLKKEDKIFKQVKIIFFNFIYCILSILTISVL